MPTTSSATSVPTPIAGDREAVLRRLRRAHGQLAAVIRMLDEERPCEEILTQMSAVHRATSAAAFSLVAGSLRECVRTGKDPESLERLFVRLA